MMHLCPDLVRRDELANFRPRSLDMEGEYEILTPEGRIGFGWETQDLSLPRRLRRRHRRRRRARQAPGRARGGALREAAQ
jgi:hypothetical protein